MAPPSAQEVEKVLADLMSLQQHLAEEKFQLPPEEVVNKAWENLGEKRWKTPGFFTQPGRWVGMRMFFTEKTCYRLGLKFDLI